MGIAHIHMSLLEHVSVYCRFLKPLPSCVSAPRGEACFNICITSRSKAAAARYVFLLWLVNI